MEKKKSKLTLSIIIFLILFAMFFFSGQLIPEDMKNNIVSGSLMISGIKILISVLCFATVKKLYGRNFNINGKCLGKGIFRYGLPFLLLMAVQLTILSEIKIERSFGEALPALLLALALNMLTGVFEESLCRGFLFNAMRSEFGEDKKGITKAALLSSLFFGVAHFVNLINNPGIPVSTFTQVIYAFLFGVLFCVIYFRTENLLIPIILHGLVDFSAEFWGCFAKASEAAESAPKDADIGSVIFILILSAPMFIAGLLQLKKAFKDRNEELTDNAVQTA